MLAVGSDADAFTNSGSVVTEERNAGDTDVPESDVEFNAAERAAVNKEYIPPSPQTWSQRHPAERGREKQRTLCKFSFLP